MFSLIYSNYLHNFLKNTKKPPKYSQINHKTKLPEKMQKPPAKAETSLANDDATGEDGNSADERWC